MIVERLWAIIKGLLKDYEDHQRLLKDNG